MFAALPASVHDIMARFGLDSIGTLQARLSDAAVKGSWFVATNVLNFGMNAIVMWDIFSSQKSKFSGI